MIEKTNCFLKGRLALRTTLTGRPEGSSHPATSGGLRGMFFSP